MKIKHALLLYALGLCLDNYGALRKITHSHDAVTLLTMATFLKLLGIVLFVAKLFYHPKAKEFLNW